MSSIVKQWAVLCLVVMLSMTNAIAITKDDLLSRELLKEELVSCQASLADADSHVDHNMLLNKLGLLGTMGAVAAVNIYLTISLVETTNYFNLKHYPKMQLLLEKISMLPFGDHFLAYYLTSSHLPEKIVLKKNADCTDLLTTIWKGGVLYRRVSMRTFSDLGVLSLGITAAVPVIGASILYLERDQFLAPTTEQIWDQAKLELNEKSALAKQINELEKSIGSLSVESDADRKQLLSVIDTLISLLQESKSNFDEQFSHEKDSGTKRVDAALVERLYYLRLCKLEELKLAILKSN